MSTRKAPNDLQQQLIASGSRMHGVRRTFLFHRGDAVTGIFLIASGAVELRLDERPTALPPQHLGPGSVLGLPAALSNSAYSLSAEVLEDSELVFLPREGLLALLREQPQLCFPVMSLLSDELSQTRSTLERARSVAAKNAERSTAAQIVN
jgi:CRP-like cAMP-binding protein